MLTKIIAALGFVGGIFLFFLGKQSEKNKQTKRKVKTYDEANKTRKEVKNISDDKLDDELDSLLND